MNSEFSLSHAFSTACHQAGNDLYKEMIEIGVINLGERTANTLKYMFHVPKTNTKRTIRLENQSYYISFRHHVMKNEEILNQLNP